MGESASVGREGRPFFLSSVLAAGAGLAMGGAAAKTRGGEGEGGGVDRVLRAAAFGAFGAVSATRTSHYKQLSCLTLRVTLFSHFCLFLLDLRNKHEPCVTLF